MNTVVEITAAQTARAGIKKGQRAWSQIKATAEEQRVLWLEVGVALMYGKIKENRADGQKFSEWVQEKFEGLDTHDYAPAALWYANEFPKDSEKLIPTGMADPVCIRRWFNEQQTTLANTDPVLRDAPAPTSKITLDKSIGKRVASLYHRSKTNDEGSPIAAKHLTAYAKQHGVTEEELKVAAQESAPDAYYRFSPSAQQQIDHWRDSVRLDISAMERTGLPREAIRSLLINLAHSL
jgi:hypothetical protein